MGMVSSSIWNEPSDGIKEEIKQGRWGGWGRGSGTNALSFTEGLLWVSLCEGLTAVQGHD